MINKSNAPDTLLIVFMALLCLFGCAPAQKQRAPAETMTAARNDLSVDLTATIDLSAQKITYNYSLENTTKEKTKLVLISPDFPQESRKLKIGARETETASYSGDVKITALTTNTKYVSFKPYLLVRENGRKDRLLFTDYRKLSVRITLPPAARILKSSVPRVKQVGNVAMWQAQGVKIIPPFDIWYTVAPENVTVAKRVTEDGAEVRVTIEIENSTPQDIRNLRLTTQFPATLYSALPEKSEGVFLAQNRIMIRWQGAISRVKSGDRETIVFTVVKKSKEARFMAPEILVYNQTGDLIAVK